MSRQFFGTFNYKRKEMTKLIYTIYSFSKKRLSVRKQARHQATTSALTLQGFPEEFPALSMLWGVIEYDSKTHHLPITFLINAGSKHSIGGRETLW
jgi:hypothetical protein